MSILSEHKRRKRTVADANGNHIPVSEWTHADSVELENGLTLKDSEKFLTQAEYNALSNEEKMNGTKYWITDANIESSSIDYDNSVSGYESTDMQGAMDELYLNFNEVEMSFKDVVVPLLAESWVSKSDGTYSYTVTLEGITVHTNPMVMLKPIGEDVTEEELDAYTSIYDITTTENTIYFEANEKPSIDFYIILKNIAHVDGENIAVNELVENLEETTVKVNNLETEFNNLETNVNTLSSTVDTNTADIATLNSDLTNMVWAQSLIAKTDETEVVSNDRRVRNPDGTEFALYNNKNHTYMVIMTAKTGSSATTYNSISIVNFGSTDAHVSVLSHTEDVYPFPILTAEFKLLTGMAPLGYSMGCNVSIIKLN